MCRDEKHPKRGFDPQAKGGITPVRVANEPRAARAQRMANPSPSASIMGYYGILHKKPAVLRDFSCIDLCLVEKCPFLCHNIPLSIQPPCYDSQKTKQVELMRKTFII